MNYWRSLPAGFDRTAVIVIYAATPRANPGYLRFRERVRYVASRRLFRFSVACRIEFLESSPWMSSPYTMMPYTMISPMLMPMRSATEARRCPAEALDDHGLLGSGQTSGFISRLLAALALVLVVGVVAKVIWESMAFGSGSRSASARRPLRKCYDRTSP